MLYSSRDTFIILFPCTIAFKIDLIGPEDDMVLPPVYFRIPSTLEKGKIKFDVKIFSMEDVRYEEVPLVFYWDLTF